MKRKSVNPTLVLITEKLTALKEDRENNLFIYATRDKYLPGHGYVNELPTITSVIECQKEIQRQEIAQSSFTDSESVKAMKELGIEDDTVEAKAKPVRILGFPVKYWNDDLKVRISEIRSDKAIIDLENAKTFLTSNMSEDDKNEEFNKQLSSITNLLK